MRTILALVPLFLACQSNAGLSYDRVHLSVSDEAGMALGTVPQDNCLTLPVLLGSRVKARYRLDSALEVILDADRESLQVRFDGASARRDIPVGQLSDTPIELEVQSPTGATFTVALLSGCASSTP